MKNLDLKYHRAKLGIIRNRLFIIYGAFLFLWAFSFVMGFLVLNRLEELSQEIREGQKGNTCILLIKPEDRTKENLRECIDNNKTKNDVKFDFKEANQDTSFKAEPEPQLSSGVQPLQVQQRPVFNPLPTVEVPKAEEPPAVEIEVRKKETKINSDGEELIRLETDTIWMTVGEVVE